jgi:hypothetical protein
MNYGEKRRAYGLLRSNVLCRDYTRFPTVYTPGHYEMHIGHLEVQDDRGENQENTTTKKTELK